MSKIKIIECPRDAMQGIHEFIPTETKIEYLNQLLKVGFHTLDFGSFVSPKAIPQLKDTWKIVNRLEMDQTKTKLLAIVANERGAREASEYDEITYLGYPFSISETFQKRNTNKSLEESILALEVMKNICDTSGKELVVYISMAFGNPYQDVWDPAYVSHWVDRIAELGVDTFSLADTVGIAEGPLIQKLVFDIIDDFPKLEIGVHLHTKASNWQSKLEAAYLAGCKRFDGALKGFGGCPFAKDELVGNLATENVIGYLSEQDSDLDLEIDLDELKVASEMVLNVMG